MFRGFIGFVAACLGVAIIVPIAAPVAALAAGAPASVAAAAVWRGPDCGDGPAIDASCALVPVQTLTEGELVEYFPVSLRCPDQNNGVLELVERRPVGTAWRYLARFEGGRATVISIDLDNYGRGYRRFFDLQIRAPAHAGEAEFGRDQAARLEPIFNNVCHGSASGRVAYETTLASNRAFFETWVPDQTGWYFETSLRCPVDNGGTLELVQRNRYGETENYFVTFDGATAIDGYSDSVSPSGEATMHSRLAIQAQESSNDYVRWSLVRRTAERAYALGCQGPAADRARYLQRLANNEAFFRTWVPVPYPPD